jgi:hypothetical protein
MDRVFIESTFLPGRGYPLFVRHKYRGNMREELTWPEEVASLSGTFDIHDAIADLCDAAASDGRPIRNINEAMRTASE